MSASIEHRLLCKIVELQDFHTVEKLKIDDSFFLCDAQTKEIFRFLSEHYHNEHTYGSVPSWEVVQTRFYGFPWSGSNDTIPTLCQELRRNKMRAELLNLIDEVSNSVQADPVSAMNAVKDAVSRMTSEHEVSNDLLLSQAVDKLEQDYDLIATSGGITGIPYPWDILNEDTQGMHPGHLIIFYGRPKNLKSWVALVIATNAYMKGQRVLVWSNEMSGMEVLRRVACIIAKVDYDKFKKAKLDPASKKKVFEILKCLKDEELAKGVYGHQSAFMATRPSPEYSGVSSLAAKIREFDPDLVIVDGLYLMKDDRSKIRTVDWKSIAHISQDLKRAAGQYNIPIIGVTQANRQADKDPKKADLVELAYADALAQDCDLCIRVFKHVDPTTHNLELALSVAGGRETTLDGFVIHGIPATNFEFKRGNLSDPERMEQSSMNGHSKNGVSAKKAPAAILPGWGKR
jgi:replicative DNA helicase